MPRTTFSYKKMSLFSSLSLFFLSFFFTSLVPCDKSEREEPPQRANRQGREGVPLGSRRLGTFLILFFVLSSQKSLTGFRSINRVMNLFFLLILVFYALFHSPSFAGANYWSLLSLSSQNGVLKERRKMKKKFFEIIHEVRNIKFLLSSPVLLSFFFSFRYLSFLPYFPPDRIQDFLFFC